MMNTLTPIASDLSDIYGYTPVVINLGTKCLYLGGLLYILMHPIFTFPAAYVIDSKGTRAGIVLGSVLGIVGASLRMLVNQGFWLVIAGQILAGIGRPFILNCQAKISGNWFHATKRVNKCLFLGRSHPATYISPKYLTHRWNTDPWDHVQRFRP